MERKTAFVFSGGASLGSIEVGMLKAISEYGLMPDMILGTSVGSLNGAFYAFNPSPSGLQKIEEIWGNITFTDVFTPSPLTPVKNLATFGKYLISPKNLRKVIKKHLPGEYIEQATIPLYIISTDIKTGKQIVFNEGLVLEALMASAGIPAVFPPLSMDGDLLVDGGVINNTPISTAIKLGATRIIIFPIGFPYTPEELPKNIEDLLVRSIMYLLNRQLAADIHIFKDQAELIYIPPPDNVTTSPIDFTKSKKLIEKSYTKAKDWLNNHGLKSNVDDLNLPFDVIAQKLNYKTAILPDKDKEAMERIKENISSISDEIKDNINEQTDKFKQSIKMKKEAIKKKFHKNDSS